MDCTPSCVLVSFLQDVAVEFFQMFPRKEIQHFRFMSGKKQSYFIPFICAIVFGLSVQRCQRLFQSTSLSLHCIALKCFNLLMSADVSENRIVLILIWNNFQRPSLTFVRQARHMFASQVDPRRATFYSLYLALFYVKMKLHCCSQFILWPLLASNRNTWYNDVNKIKNFHIDGIFHHSSC
jgi:hypothetical protein